MGLQTRATAAPIVLVWCSEVKTYSPEAPSYKTTISFKKSTVQHTVLCCAAGFMTGMEKSPTGKANSSPASQEISSILCSPQVRHHVHNSPPSVHTLSPPQFNIIPCTSRSPKWSHSIRFLHQNPVHICVSYVPHVPPIHPTRFDHPNIILFRQQYKP